MKRFLFGLLFLSIACASPQQAQEPPEEPAGAPTASTPEVASGDDASHPEPTREFDYGEEVARALGFQEKSGMDGLEQQRDFGRFLLAISSMKNVATALEMYRTDRDRFPEDLKALVPDYLRSQPEYVSGAERKTFASTYRSLEGGKGYSFSVEGEPFSQFGVPKGYPRMSSADGLVLKPGVPEPRRPEDVANDLFREGATMLPEVTKTKDPALARKGREKLEAAIATGNLEPGKAKQAQQLIDLYRGVESSSGAK